MRCVGRNKQADTCAISQGAWGDVLPGVGVPACAHWHLCQPTHMRALLAPHRPLGVVNLV